MDALIRLNIAPLISELSQILTLRNLQLTPKN